MEAAPPKAAEILVGVLIPPACREEVLGDLHERYTSPRRYIGDAICVVPLVILSRILRTTDPQVFLMEALAGFLSFLAAAWYLNAAVLEDRLGFARLAIPTAMTVLASMLADAYASPGIPAPAKAFRSLAMGTAFAFVSQAMLWTWSRELAAPPSILFFGGALSLLLVSTIRILFRSLPNLQDPVNGPTLFMRQPGGPVNSVPHAIRRDAIRCMEGAAPIVVIAIVAACVGYPALLRPRFLVTAITVAAVYRLSKRD